MTTTFVPDVNAAGVRVTCLLMRVLAPICTTVWAPLVAVTVMLPLLAALTVPVTDLNEPVAGHVGVGLTLADAALALLPPHPTSTRAMPIMATAVAPPPNAPYRILLLIDFNLVAYAANCCIPCMLLPQGQSTRWLAKTNARRPRITAHMTDIAGLRVRLAGHPVQQLGGRQLPRPPAEHAPL
jgi:hypothetical protein